MPGVVVSNSASVKPKMMPAGTWRCHRVWATSCTAHTLRRLSSTMLLNDSKFSTMPPCSMFAHTWLSRQRRLDRRSVRVQYRKDATDQAPSVSSSAIKSIDRTVVLAVDDTEDSEFACDWVIQQFAKKGDKLHLIHCAPALSKARVYATANGKLIRLPGVEPALLEEKMRQDCLQMMEKRFSSRLQEAEIPFETEVLLEPDATDKGGIGKLLAARATDMGAASIILASHSHGGLPEFVLGSVASYLVHNSTIPVAVLHKPSNQKRMPWWLYSTVGDMNEEMAEHREGERDIFVAVDESDDSMQSVQWVVDNMYRPGDCFHLLHVIPALPSQAIYSLAPDGMLYSQPLPKEDLEFEEHWWRDSMEKRFKLMLEERKIPFIFDVLTDYSQDPMESIGRALCVKAERMDAAALVLSAHGKDAVLEFLLGSVSNYCAHHCKQPVVVLHGTSYSDDD